MAGPLRIIDHVLQLNGARFVHLDPAPVPIDAKTRSAYRAANKIENVVRIMPYPLAAHLPTRIRGPNERVVRAHSLGDSIVAARTTL